MYISVVLNKDHRQIKLLLVRVKVISKVSPVLRFIHWNVYAIGIYIKMYVNICNTYMNICNILQYYDMVLD